jgi:hypothetical protein
MPTCEDNVGLRLKAALFQNPNTVVLSYHPPNGKAYETDLIRIPKRGLRKSAVRDRYHIDLIFIVGDSLVLVELKCNLSESSDDINKLREIKDTYPLEDLKRLIAARLTTVSTDVLDNINDIVIALGVEIINSEVPNDFVVFEAKEAGITVRCGNEISEATRDEFQAIFNMGS